MQPICAKNANFLGKNIRQWKSEKMDKKIENFSQNCCIWLLFKMWIGGVTLVKVGPDSEFNPNLQPGSGFLLQKIYFFE